MKLSIQQKLQQIAKRHKELGALLNRADVVNDHLRFRDLSKEYAQLQPIVDCFMAYQDACDNKEQVQALLKNNSVELQELAQEELSDIEHKLVLLDNQLKMHLLPKDPDDDCDIFLEIRAGTGGDEAAIFAGDLFRMYGRYAEMQGWQVEIVSRSNNEHGGYKEVIASISGDNVYAKLKFESGAHRVQRVPVTESQGRIHTSACTVAILPKVKMIESVELNPSDLRIDTYRASGAGGQHVNRTDSAVRITHLPSGIVVECQDERSQHKNKARGMSLLRARLLAVKRAKQESERAAKRRQLVGSGDRSERIRTYNYPQGRITDHRIHLTLYKLLEVMEGHLEQIIQPLSQEHQADLLAESND